VRPVLQTGEGLFYKQVRPVLQTGEGLFYKQEKA
jgi:hypothetical protein